MLKDGCHSSQDHNKLKTNFKPLIITTTIQFMFPITNSIKGMNTSENV
uniref:Uncharacterized protein n=1 Tax=Anguilla anguilla TaxID=7936 RepID=A0A0E9WT24_ANGAN